MQTIVIVAIVLAMTVLWPSRAGAADRVATTCEEGPVQTAINAAQAGDRVVVPAGTCHWTSQVNWDPAPANTLIEGAGIGVTIILDDYASNQSVLVINTSTSGTFRMTGLEVRGGTGMIKDNGMIKFNGENAQFRFDHNRVRVDTYSPSNAGAGVFLFGCLYGVIDHNVFDSSSINNMAPNWGNGCDAGGEGDGPWAQATGFGGSTYLVYEDNTFNSATANGVANDCSHGGKFVFRYNTFHTTAIQTHPLGSASRARGCRALEIYLNSFDGTGAASPSYNVAFLSAGSMLVWGNIANDGYQNFVTLHSMRKDNSTYPQTATPNGWGYCGTAFNGTGSNWDQNASASTGKRCLDQPGNGVGDLLSGNFPNVTNTATGCISSQACAWARQALEPVYEWLNTWTTEGGGSFWAVFESTVLVANEEYYLYTGSFTGAAGVGSGSRGSRPATCTAGVAWWSTDQGGNWDTTHGGMNDGTLDKCTATDTWTNAYYTPYTYPHPLQGVGESAGTPVHRIRVRP